MGRSKYVSAYIFDRMSEILEGYYVKSMGLILAGTVVVIVGNVIAVLLNNVVIAVAASAIYALLVFQLGEVGRWKLRVNWRLFEETYTAPGNYLFKSLNLSLVDELIDGTSHIVLDRDVQRAYHLHEKSKEFLISKLNQIKAKQRVAAIVSVTCYLLAVPIVYIMSLLIGGGGTVYLATLLLPGALLLAKMRNLWGDS